tara:strand:- start:528 stop:989 length:462 start_codon:yes stop_codon:yes gene_type:complete
MLASEQCSAIAASAQTTFPPAHLPSVTELLSTGRLEDNSMYQQTRLRVSQDAHTNLVLAHDLTSQVLTYQTSAKETIEDIENITQLDKLTLADIVSYTRTSPVDLGDGCMGFILNVGYSEASREALVGLGENAGPPQDLEQTQMELTACSYAA